jgi:hypothetical protein
MPQQRALDGVVLDPLREGLVEMAAIIERRFQGRFGGGSKPKHATGNAGRVFSVDVGSHGTETRAEAH